MGRWPEDLMEVRHGTRTVGGGRHKRVVSVFRKHVNVSVNIVQGL